jgi:hypothetical protein
MLFELNLLKSLIKFGFFICFLDRILEKSDMTLKNDVRLRDELCDKSAYIGADVVTHIHVTYRTKK